MLEPCDAKVSRTVPRGLDDRKVVRLLGKNAKVIIWRKRFGVRERSLLKIPYSPWRSHISNESETQPAYGSRESRERNLPMYGCKRDCSGASSKAQEDAARCAMDSGFSGSPSFIAVV